ncbi:MAG: hydantoinase/oxoprolinase family protein [Gammaproteobacteria bacterium]
MTKRIGVDIGGTFTDLVVYDTASGRISVEKVPTTPAAPEEGCVNAVRLAGEKGALRDCEYFLHGTTVGLNALLERRGATVGLLCTEGFRDALEIRRGSRPESYDLNWVPPEPLVPRHRRLPVRERMDAQGAVVLPLDRLSVVEACAMFRQQGVTSVAICFMNAYVNPAHEVEAAEALREAGFPGDISLSHQLSREYRDYERTSTTVVDAFVRTRMSDYLDKVVSGIHALGFKGVCLITRSGGGAMSFGEARDRAFETINSGPVAGAEGAAELARALNLGDLITADVGGTSFDTTLIVDGRPQLLYQGEIGGMPIQSPWVDVRSIGAGGGSLAYVDSGGLLHVGPQSAGAQPGPACYGRGGTEPTVTDAAFFLGMLGSGRLASSVNLDRNKAEAALGKVADRLGIPTRALAVGIIEIACSSCANAIREITVEQGIDPRALKLLAFGGAGPLLATQIARELNIRTIVVPPFAGNFSAWGLLGSDLVRSSARTQLFTLASESLRALNTTVASMFAELEQRGEDRSFLDQGRRELALGMRFTGQEHSLTIPVPWSKDGVGSSGTELDRVFRDTYRKTFGIALDNTVEIIVLRTAIRKPLLREIARPGAGDAHARDRLPSLPLHSFARSRELAGATLSRAFLKPGERHPGPAVIYEDTTTTYVDADFSYGIDTTGCLVLTREE